MTDLHNVLHAKQEVTLCSEDLEDAIIQGRKVIEKLLPAHLDYPNTLDHMVNMLYKRFQASRDIADLENAIEYAQTVASVVLAEHPQRGLRLYNIDAMLFNKYELTDSTRDLEKAIESAKAIIAAVDPHHILHHAAAQSVSTRTYLNVPRPSELPKSLFDEFVMENYEVMLSAMSEEDPDRLDFLVECINLKQAQFKQTGKLEPLNQVLALMDQVIEILPEDSLMSLLTKCDAAGMLLMRHDIVGDYKDIEKSLAFMTKGLEGVPKDHPKYGSILNTMGNLYEKRHFQEGSKEWIEKATDIAKKAVEYTPKGHDGRPRTLTNLSNKLEKLFIETGDVTHLEQAMIKAQEAVTLCPEDYPDRAACFANLAFRLVLRFQWAGRTEDMEDAINALEQAMNMVPEGHSSTALLMDGLGNLLESRFDRTGHMDDLERAIELAMTSISLTPSGHVLLPGRQLHLSLKFVKKVTLTRVLGDMDRAIEYGKRCIEQVSEEHSEHKAMLFTLGITYMKRLEESKLMLDLENAVAYSIAAVSATPEGHAMLAMMLNHLGHQLNAAEILCQRDEKIDEMRAADRILDCFMKSWKCAGGDPLSRIDSANQAIKILIELQDWGEAHKIAYEAIGLLSTLSNRSLNSGDQQHFIAEFAGVVGVACSLSIQLNEDVTKALEVIENGRGLILGLIIDSRRDISQLETDYPIQAKRYLGFQMDLSAPVERSNSKLQDRMMERRIRTARELENCIQEIRQLPRYERFLLGQSWEDLQASVTEGAIVIVNISSFRSDAIMISKSAITTVHLPEITHGTVDGWVKEDLPNYKTREGYRVNNRRYREILMELWHNCVQPVIKDLEGHHGFMSDTTPRIWWIGVGLATYLPFHAAGDLSPGSRNNTLSRVISSYTPTIKSLSFARERLVEAWKHIADNPKLFIATMPTTPGLNDLIGVVTEGNLIKQVTNGKFETQSAELPSALDVVGHLKKANLIHFACHGLADMKDPFESSLVFQRTAPDASAPQQDLLKVRQISHENVEGVFLAYLSACSTAENRAIELADEVIHIASGFQVAGFPHTIGSMWLSYDEMSIDMAGIFYTQLTENTTILGDSKAVPLALHKSILQVCKKKWKQPLAWAQYIHLGA
ncbi:hypothetical protein DM02DRAFT_533118 [Periconia macrospinosa]|uniref:CHAT domain-containing protein n=1 Tax=Periconia macrospinosa TaxID=97972 RepID=A0A2V1DJZ8_9PLEO|nr:hypothetical protein DM02DRAFT_533118 [Periconia macrospinosa]